MAESIEIDASGVPPRQEENVCEEETATAVKTNNEAEETELYVCDEAKTSESIPDTDSVISDVSQSHDGWSFNAVLLDLADELKPREFAKMRFMFIEEIGRGSLEQMTNPEELFDVMRKRTRLSSVNLLQLCALLKIVKRNDLIQKIVDYAQNTENAIYMQPATLTPVNGYKHVQFHVRGRDFTRITKRDLHEFRNTVAAMLAIPTRFVLIDGVNPSLSIIITLLLPNVHVNVLQSLLENQDEPVTIELIFAGVDTVNVSGHKFVVQEIPSELTLDDPENKQKDIALFELLQASYRCLEETGSENIALKRQLNQMEKTKTDLVEKFERTEIEVIRLQAENDMWRLSAKPKGLFEEDGDNRTINGSENDCKEPKQDDIIKALENFQASVNQLSAENCNKQLVLKLLQSHVTLISTRCYNELSALITRLMMQAQGVFYGMISAVTISEIQKLMGDIEVKEEPIELKALRKISSELSLKEQRMLAEAYGFDKKDRDLVASGIAPFLLILLHKVHGNAEVNMTEFLRNCLTKIERTDLLLMFIHEIRTPSTERTNMPSSRQKSEESQTDNEFTMESVAKNVKMLVEKVDKIDSRLTAMHAMPSLDNIKNMASDYANILYKHMKPERAGVHM